MIYDLMQDPCTAVSSSHHEQCGNGDQKFRYSKFYAFDRECGKVGPYSVVFKVNSVFRDNFSWPEGLSVVLGTKSGWVHARQAPFPLYYLSLNIF